MILTRWLHHVEDQEPPREIVKLVEESDRRVEEIERRVNRRRRLVQRVTDAREEDPLAEQIRRAFGS